MRPLILGLLCGLIAAANAQWKDDEWREDDRCGPDFPAPNGKGALCRDIKPYPTCCQVSGHCGWDCNGSEYEKFANISEGKKNHPFSA